MRVLGVDPGLTRCGVGVVDSRRGRRAALVGVGVLGSAPGTSTDLRLLTIADGLESWLDEHTPDVVAVERVFAQNNRGTVMGTAQVAGLAMVAAARRGVPVALHTPSEVKAAVTGSGRAEKAQVQRMVASILRLDTAPSPADAADALALAITHLWRPAGALQGGDHHELTPAQRAWAAAEHRARGRQRAPRTPRKEHVR
ncbi:MULTISPECIES: crossover junction endodeoxyribonuclease RuvC [Isoptericola]|uniref:Crossover junction endodeoxyribonuclease RuvC n=1 Tax=Isoptericola sediminis TaxID=2733572 RepID=A0A849KA83_9MICO|nr:MULTISPECIES: crossover junction endodeoxyribonuclease RuvC [unclassified Isoptericola]MDO8145073.1 crossover junction endodeoxyribonuclease RuvC [Isoptericola sp. 178]MDO8148707.1 crossover junction endodeoxyribonuclease RuvC [Isoptericola sp. b515]MDO8151347.1 crossover junction endodeoxyribonuclease RuvC [Isoptericola sp. b408]NNU28695.1 crossover junction endodeoxyribonuclease RuvC [Isoptericola sediminis]